MAKAVGSIACNPWRQREPYGKIDRDADLGRRDARLELRSDGFFARYIERQQPGSEDVVRIEGGRLLDRGVQFIDCAYARQALAQEVQCPLAPLTQVALGHILEQEQDAANLACVIANGRERIAPVGVFDPTIALDTV